LIRIVPETGSTSADLAARLRAGELVPEGEWLVALRQTSGRGRFGRQWFDGEGNFMGSTMVHLRRGDPAATGLALVAGLALHACLAPMAPGVLLKWPNDLMVGDAKLAGILLERVGDAVIVGIGVNLAVAPPVEGRATVALSGFGSPPTPQVFAARLSEGFTAELERWRTTGSDSVIRRWMEAAHPIGTALQVGGTEGPSGTFAGLDPAGGLQLRLSDGTTQTVHAGEVTFAGPRR